MSRPAVTEVSVQDLSEHADELIDRAAAGERIVVVRSGQPVAELLPVMPRLSAAEVRERFRSLPPVDAAFLRDVRGE